jgi:dihydroorotate dehydrogenase
MASLRLTVTGRRLQLTHYSFRSFTSTIEPPSPLRRVAYVTLFALTASLGAVYYFDSRAAIHRYVIAPVIRHALDPESSHRLAVSVLASGWGPRDMLTDDERLKTEVKCIYTSYSHTIDTFIL